MHLTDRQKKVLFQPIRVAISGWAFANQPGLESRIQRGEALVRAYHPLVQPIADELLQPLRAELYNLKAKQAPKIQRQYGSPVSGVADDRNLSKRRT